MTKRIEAKVKAESAITVVTAFGGFTVTRRDWVLVPIGDESEAANHPMLETRSFKESAAAETEPDAPAVNASKAAVKLASENGLDLALVEGTGSGGAITKGDVIAALVKRDTLAAGEG